MTTVYDADITVTMRGVDDAGVGLPFTVNPFDVCGREALVEIREGEKGDPGPPGAPSWPWVWMGDAADFATLQALGLTTADARKAWRAVDEQALYLWTGLDWIRFRDAFGATGRQGPANTLTGAAIAGAPGSSAAAILTGTAPNQTLTVTMPRGEEGDQGDPGTPGAIADAADVGDISTARQDSVLAWDDDADLWEPVPNPRLAGPWAIAGAQFAGGSNIGDALKTLATMIIPAQPVAWRPLILSGSVNYMVQTSVINGSRVDIEVRLGSIDGPLIGYGVGLGAQNQSQIGIFPKFEYPLSPASTTAVIEPNQTATLYVLARRVSGTAAYTISTAGAQLIVMAQPIRNAS
ncbi:putative phage tail protein [Nocardia nova SH22a]|uniref:Putative phage tail protein n=1 Tax=Nocardia nova SH22a TaxID=1415166 RepID=W5TB50_9NOCA|nr:hypothetical protein [Nocardia nova]AHH16595.1 putative phage tail protein [Nocardia nova SH22a]